MGYKVITFATAMVWSAAAAAADFNIGYLGSKEDAGFTASTWDLVYRPGKLGLRTHETTYSNGTGTRGIAADIQAGAGPIWVEGWIGRTWAGARSYGDSDLNVNMEVGGGLTLNGSYSGGTIVGATLAAGTLDYRGYTLGVDWTAGVWGAALSARAVDRSDGNNLTGGSAKVWRTVYPGVTVYLSAKGSRNDSTPGTYFSPLTNTRVGVGVAYRKFWKTGNISFTVEPGRTEIDGVHDSVLLWRGSAEYKVSNWSKVNVAFGRDYSRSGAYTYNYRQIMFKMSH